MSCSFVPWNDKPRCVTPATPQIRYFESRQGYYTQYRKRQRLLAKGPKDEPDSPTYQAAVEKFAEIMHLSKADKVENGNLVCTILELYAKHLKNQGRTRTLEMVMGSLQSANEEFGKLKYEELKLYHVQTWLDRMGTERGRSKGNRLRKWGHTMKRLAIDKLQAAFSWGEQQGLISHNLIDRRAKKALGLRRKGSRGREYVLQPDEHEKLVAIAKPHFADLLKFLKGTGCRPGEAYHAEATHYDRKLGAIIYRWDATEGYIHKTAQKTGKDRVIYLAPDLVALVQRLCEKNPTGYLFRNRDGGQWTDSAVYLMLKRLRTRLKLISKMIAYSYRHTFATNWLKNGGSIKVLAELMGNSVAMIEQHYGHLDADRETMRKLLCTFNANQKAKAGNTPLPVELVDRIISVVMGFYGKLPDEEAVNLRNLLGDFRVSAAIGKTQSHDQPLTPHLSAS